MNRFAVHRVYIDSETYVARGVVTLDEGGAVCSIETLNAEVPFTQWIGGVIFLSPQSSLTVEEVSQQWLQTEAHCLTIHGNQSIEDLQSLSSSLFLDKDKGTHSVSKNAPVYAWFCESFDFQKNQFYQSSSLIKLV